MQGLEDTILLLETLRNMFDPRLLASFMAVAQHKHFGKAAEVVHATQPGVSQHVAKLEAQLGFRLLDRTKRSVALTEAGEAFHAQAKNLLAMIERMCEEGSQIASGMLGQLAVGMTSSVIYSDVPDRISRFKKENPRIEPRFIVQAGNFLKQLLDDGTLDVAISTLPMDDPSYRSVKITSQQMGVALPKSHPLATRGALTLDALRGERFIVVPREYDAKSHDTLLARMRALGATIHIAAYETPSLNAIARVAVGEGITLIPLGYRSEHNDAVHVVRLRDPELASIALYATCHVERLRTTVDRFMGSIVR